MKILIVGTFLISLVAEARTTTLKFDKTAAKTGKIFFLVFNDPGSFPDKPGRAIKNGVLPVSSSQSSVQIQIDLPDGRYAVSAFLDENGNGKLDKGMFGIPKERFGFSNNPTITTGAPSFQEAEIEVGPGSNSHTINLLKLF